MYLEKKNSEPFSLLLNQKRVLVASRHSIEKNSQKKETPLQYRNIISEQCRCPPSDNKFPTCSSPTLVVRQNQSRDDVNFRPSLILK